MQKILTAKIMLVPASSDKQCLLDAMKAYSAACNYVSEYVSDNNMPLIQARIHGAVYKKCRSKYGLPSQMAASVTRTVITSYKKEDGIKNRRDQKRPVFKAPQLSLVWNRDYSLIWNAERTESLFSIGTLQGRVKCSFRDDALGWAFTKDAKYGTAKLVFKHGKFFLHVPVTVEVPDVPDASEYVRVVGVDRGMRFLATTYDGRRTSFYSGAKVGNRLAHNKEILGRLRMRKTSSARRRFRAIRQMESRWMNDVNHCLSKTLVSSNPGNTLFVLENFNGAGEAHRRVRVNGRVVEARWPYRDFEKKIAYKASRLKSSVIFADPTHTSHTCPVCGRVDKKSRKYETHTFKCIACGYTTNDDRAGAMNLQRMGIEYLLKAQVSKT